MQQQKNIKTGDNSLIREVTRWGEVAKEFLGSALIIFYQKRGQVF